MNPMNPTTLTIVLIISYIIIFGVPLILWVFFLKAQKESKNSQNKKIQKRPVREIE